MKYLNNLIFEDLIDRFKWYPKPFYLTIICQDAQSLETFCKVINDYNIKWDFVRKMSVYNTYIKENKRIDIIFYSPNVCRNRRTNATIFDSNIPANIVEEVILPSTNIEPSYGGIAYQRATLKEELTQSIINEKYEINLEDY